MKSKIFIFGFIIVIFVACIGPCRRAGKWLVKNDKPEHADAMVILMGTVSERIREAADLYKQKVTGKILIVGPALRNDHYDKGIQARNNSLESRYALIARGLPPDSIIILPGYVTRRTLTEALTVEEYLADKSGIDTLVLVSSSLHMQRASMIFESVFSSAGQHVVILCSPSKYTKFNPEKWWSTGKGIRIVLMEYLKMAIFILIDRWSLEHSGKH